MAIFDDEMLESPEVEIKTPEEEHSVSEIFVPEVSADNEQVLPAEEKAPLEVPNEQQVDYQPPWVDLDALATNLDQKEPHFQAQRDLEAIDAVCLYDYDQDFRDMVNAHPQYHVYKDAFMRRGRDADFEIGKDWLDAMERAGYADRGMSKMPREACRSYVASMPDTKERVKWQEELEKQDIRSKTDAIAYYEIAGRIHREELAKQYQEEEKAYNEQLADQAQVAAYNDELKNYIVNPDQQEDISPGLRQILRNTGSEKKLDAVHNAMSRFNWQGSEGQERVHYIGSMMEAYWDLKDNPEARQMFMQTIAQRAYDGAKEGKTNFVRGVGEGLLGGVQDAANWLFGTKWFQGGEAFDALADLLPGDVGRRILAGYRATINQLGGDSPDEAALNAANWLFGTKWFQGGEAFDALADLLPGDSPDEAAQNAEALSQFNRDITAFIGEFDAAVEQGRQLAEQEEGSMGFWRQSGTLVGEILPALIGGGVGAAKLAPEAGVFLARAGSSAARAGRIGYGVLANSVFASSAEESEFARMLADGVAVNEDSAKAARATGLGNLAAFSVGMPLLNRGMSFAMPGLSVAGEKIGEAVTKAVSATGSQTVAQGVELAGLTAQRAMGSTIVQGAQRVMDKTIAQVFNKGAQYLTLPTMKGVAARLSMNTVTNAANFGLLIPTVTAAVAGVTEEAMNVNPEYRTAYQRYVESMKQLADLDHDKMMLGQSMLLAAMHAPSDVARSWQGRKTAIDTIEGYAKQYELMGGRKEDLADARKKHGLNVPELIKDLNDRLRKQCDEDPVAFFNRAADASQAEYNKEQAEGSLTNNTIKFLLARNSGVAAEQLPDGKIRIYTRATVDEKGINPGDKYQDYDADIAMRTLGRIAKGAYTKMAEELNDAIAGRVVVEHLKSKGYAEDTLKFAQGREAFEADAAEARARRLSRARELDPTITDEEEADPAILARAGSYIDNALSTELTLNELIDLPGQFESRLQTEAARGGTDSKTAAYVVRVVRDGKERRVLRHAPGEASFFAYAEEAIEGNVVDLLANDAMREALKLQQASGTEMDVAYPLEELAGQLLSMRNWMRETEGYKSAADSWLGISKEVENKLERNEDLSQDEYNQLRRDVLEAFSMLFKSGMVSDAMTGRENIPAWMRPVIAACVKSSTNAEAYNTLGKAIANMEKMATESQGVAKQYENLVTRLNQENRELFDKIFEDYKEGPTPEQIVAMQNERIRAQREADEKYGEGRSIAPERTDEDNRLADQYKAIDQAAKDAVERELQSAENEKRQELKDIPGNEDLTEEEVTRQRAEGEADAKQDDMAAKQAAGDPTVKNDEDGIFAGGRYYVISSEGFGDVKSGLLPVDKIGFAPEVPQFKIGANEEGVVNPLSGLYRPDHDPIRVWQRKDGQLHVISGRHRLAYAKQAGATRIAAYVYKEDDVRNAQWARTLDMEQNIRDNQASELEVALYVRGENAYGRQLTEAEIDQAGINRGSNEQERRVSIGARGVMLGRYAADEVLEALRNELPQNFSANDAVNIVQFAPYDKDVQVEGLRAMVGDDPVGIETARRIMGRFLEVKKRNRDMGIGGETDLLGFGTSLMDSEFNKFYGRYQSKKLRQLSTDRKVVQGLIDIESKASPETLAAAQKRVSKRLGLNEKEKVSLQELKKRLDDLHQKWKSPSAHKELMDEMEAAFRAENEGADWLQPKAAPAEDKYEIVPVKADFSLGGERANTFGEMQEAGLTYYDPADGKWKFRLPTENIRLNTGFTKAELHAGKIDTSLGALMLYPELYRAYPQLKDMRVRLYKDANAKVGGFYAPNGIVDKEGAFIAVNVGAGTEDVRLLSTLLHESQHAVQGHEGWAMGANIFTPKQTVDFLNKAIEQRKKLGLKTDWAKANMKYLKGMLKKVNDVIKKPATSENEKEFKDLAFTIYRMAHGEQEARYAGSRRNEVVDGMPRLGSVSTETIAVNPDRITSLGGITFGRGVYAELMQTRLAPVSDFHMDRRMFQIRASAMRLATMLSGFTKEEDKAGESLLLEAYGVAERAVSLLPNDYRFAMEPYRVWLAVFSRLSKGGAESAAEAAQMVPMEAWRERMLNSFLKQMMKVFEGRVPMQELEFWMERKEGLAVLTQAQRMYNEAFAAARKALGAKAKIADVRKKAYSDLVEREDFQELQAQVFSELGKVKTEKVMAKFLERVKLQLDAYRKDKTLAAIRREVERVYPALKANGRPVKGKMDSNAYETLDKYVSLINMTRGEKDRFEEERYNGTGSEKDWKELSPDEKIEVPVYDENHKETTITCTKQEYDTYACFDAMTAEQAEAAARGIGEFITTGRNAWENAEEAAKREITMFCAPLLSTFNAGENARHEEAIKNMGVLPARRWAANLFGAWFNQAQAWDVVAHDPDVGAFGRYVGKYYEKGEVNMQVWQKERNEFLYDTITNVCGVKNREEYNKFIDSMNAVGDTGVRLVEQEPDFLTRETGILRDQLLRLLDRKTKTKNFKFKKDMLASALEYLTSKDLMQEDIAEEVMRKYGSLGESGKYDKTPEKAAREFLSDEEFDKYVNLIQEANIRAQSAREKWMEEQAKKKQEIEGRGGQLHDKTEQENLRISPGEAAYRIMLWEQDDYKDLLRRKGYTDEVVEKLKEFAGKKVMDLAYALREDLSKRTPEIKDLYERMYGLPFPQVENYFRAFFDVGQTVDVRNIGEAEGRASGSGKIPILYTRHKHNANVDPTMNVLSAYLTVQREQDVLLAFRDLPRVITNVLNYKEDGVTMRAALERRFGKGFVGSLQRHADNLQRSVGEVEQVGNDMTRLASAFGSAFAQGILNGRIGSLTKQFTALFNTIAGSDRVSLWEWNKSAGRVAAGLGIMSYKDMMNQPELSSRWRGWKAAGRNEALNAQTTDVTSYGATGSKRQAGLIAMEALDVANNVKSCQILYDAVYRQYLKENKKKPEDQRLTPQEMHELAMDEVRHSLAVKSQPMGWRTRSLMATKRSLFSVGNLFLGGESMNTFGNVAELIATGRYGAAAKVWLSNGIALQALTLAYNFLTDDEEQWKKRNAAQYLSGVIAGPIMGLPIVSQVFANFMPWYYMPQQSLLPGADLKREISKMKAAFFGKKKTSFLDKSIAVNDCLRTLGTFALLGTPSTPAQAKTKGAAYVLTFTSNLLDFLLRMGRAADERL